MIFETSSSKKDMYQWQHQKILQVDVADAYREAREAVEKAVNAQLERSADSAEVFQEWTVIAIIRAVDHPDYGEDERKSITRQS